MEFFQNRNFIAVWGGNFLTANIFSVLTIGPIRSFYSKKWGQGQGLCPEAKGYPGRNHRQVFIAVRQVFDPVVWLSLKD